MTLKSRLKHAVEGLVRFAQGRRCGVLGKTKTMSGEPGIRNLVIFGAILAIIVGGLAVAGGLVAFSSLNDGQTHSTLDITPR